MSDKKSKLMEKRNDKIRKLYKNHSIREVARKVNLSKSRVGEIVLEG